MIKTMITFIYIATIIAIASTAIISINYLVKTAAYAINYTVINTQIKTCRRASFIFTFLAWLAASFESRNECLEAYIELSSVCSRLGYIWVGYSFVCIVICILMVCLKRDTSLIKDIAKFRNTGFFMGAIFMVVSFLLNVG